MKSPTPRIRRHDSPFLKAQDLWIIQRAGQWKVVRPAPLTQLPKGSCLGPPAILRRRRCFNFEGIQRWWPDLPHVQGLHHQPPLGDQVAPLLGRYKYPWLILLLIRHDPAPTTQAGDHQGIEGGCRRCHARRSRRQDPHGAHGGTVVTALALPRCCVLAIRRLLPPPRWMGSQTAVRPHPERVCWADVLWATTTTRSAWQSQMFGKNVMHAPRQKGTT